MNAYELADELKACIDDGSTDLVCVCGAVNMLRQQADRIAELEELLKIDGDEIKILQSLLKEKQSEPVAWIRSGDGQLSLVKEKDDGYMVWKPLYLTPQTKPLSDEEIWEVIDNCFGVHAFNLDYQIALDEAREDAFELVKAILRKAQDK